MPATLTCPKCTIGRLFTDQAGDTACFACGWIPVEPLPTNIDLSGKTYPQHIASRGKAPQPWEFTREGVYAVDARGDGGRGGQAQ